MVRKAKIQDVDQMVALINYYAQKGEMLPRSRSHIYNSIRDFNVIEEDGKIVACGALHVVWDNLGEIRALAIDPQQSGKGFGKEIVEFMIQDARELELPQVFVLTYLPKFFEKIGFKQIEKNELPQKAWRDCLNCPKFPNCDEVAMVRVIQP